MFIELKTRRNYLGFSRKFCIARNKMEVIPKDVVGKINFKEVGTINMLVLRGTSCLAERESKLLTN